MHKDMLRYVICPDCHCTYIPDNERLKNFHLRVHKKYIKKRYGFDLIDSYKEASIRQEEAECQMVRDELSDEELGEQIKKYVQSHYNMHVVACHLFECLMDDYADFCDGMIEFWFHDFVNRKRLQRIANKVLPGRRKHGKRF